MLKNIFPDVYLSSVYQIIPSDLKKKNIHTMIVDMDNTIVGWGEEDISPGLKEWSDSFKKENIEIVILSNNKSEFKVKCIADKLGVKYYYHAKKPAKDGFLRVMQDLQTTPDRTIVVGDQIATDIIGGNLADCYTVFVDPLTSQAATVTKIYRIVENVFVYFVTALKIIKKKTKVFN